MVMHFISGSPQIVKQTKESLSKECIINHPESSTILNQQCHIVPKASSVAKNRTCVIGFARFYK